MFAGYILLRQLPRQFHREIRCENAWCSGQKAGKKKSTWFWRSDYSAALEGLVPFLTSGRLSRVREEWAPWNEVWKGAAKFCSCIPPSPFHALTAPPFLSSLRPSPFAQLLNCEVTLELFTGSFQSLFKDFNCSLPAVLNGARQVSPELEKVKGS